MFQPYGTPESTNYNPCLIRLNEACKTDASRGSQRAREREATRPRLPRQVVGWPIHNSAPLQHGEHNGLPAADLLLQLHGLHVGGADGTAVDGCLDDCVASRLAAPPLANPGP